MLPTTSSRWSCPASEENNDAQGRPGGGEIRSRTTAGVSVRGGRGGAGEQRRCRARIGELDKGR